MFGIVINQYIQVLGFLLFSLENLRFMVKNLAPVKIVSIKEI